MNDVPDETTYSLVMPFVVCQSNGGPFEDRSFVAGFRLGSINEQLRTAPRHSTTFRYVVEPDDVPQLDLIAMQCGLRLRTVDVEHGWVAAFLRRNA